MRQTQNISGFVHSQAYVKAIACLVLACGGALPTLAASETSSSPKVEETQQSEITVKGTVLDDAGEPVIGATIMEKGTRNGTVTDIDGNYVIKVKRNAQLSISYLGYATQVVPAGTSKVVLKSNDTKLNEVVVVGFGTQKKVNLTGAVTAVSGEELDSRPVSNATQALQGMVAGLQITQAAGSLDDTPSLNVRGTTTIGQGSSGSPLVLIDGMEGDINTINPQDIASVSVLKDAAASSIYGSRAPFGVILITTKTGGKRDKVSVNYNNNFRFSTPIRMKHSMNSVDFACMQNDANTNIGGGQLFTPDRVQRMKDWIEGEYVNAGTRKDKNGNLIYSLDADANGYWLSGFTDGYASTDFYDAIYKKHTFSQEHNVSATGGDDKLNYYASFGYLGQDGLIKVADEGSSRYTATAKISSQWTNWMKFNYSLRFIRKDYHRPQSLGSGVYEYLGGQWPCVPLYDRNGNLYNEMVNTMTNGGTYRYQNDEYNHQVGLDIEPIKNWVTHAIFNYRTSHNESHTDMQHTYLYNLNGEAYDQNNFTYVGEDYYKENYTNFQLYSEYSFNLQKKHNFRLMAGFQSEDERMKYKYADRAGLIVGNKPQIDGTTGIDAYGTPVDPSVSGNMSRWTTCGFFGRLNYDYQGKYLFEVNGRYDGSSRFRSGNQWKFFPSVSAGWNIAQENFMQPINDWIGQLKLRVSYGNLGNQNVGTYQTYQTIGVYANNGTWLQDGLKPMTAWAPGLVSQSLTWETIQSFNVGLDFAFLKDRLHGSFDWYVRKTKNMIGNAPELPSILGTAVPVTNNTDLRTNGWELTIGWNDRLSNGLQYGISFNLSDAYATITRYPNNPSHSLGNYIEGQRIGDIYGFETIGIAKSQEEMDAHIAKVDQSTIDNNKWGAGDIMYRDLNNDGKISWGANTLEDHGDLKKIGNSTPRYLFGIDLNAAWKGFDVRCFFQGVMKRDYWASTRYFFGTFEYGRWYQICLDGLQDYYRDENSWSVINGFQEPNKDAYLPRAAYSAKNEQIQTKYLQDASYIRLKNLQIGYTLPQELTRKISIEKLRVYFSGENLWTGTSLRKQYDPETIGTWYGNGYPLNTTYSFGLSLTL